MSRGKPAHVAADPGAGNPSAPVGSRDWALAVRLLLQSQTKELSQEASSVGRALAMLVSTDGWKHLHDENNKPFASVEEYCAHRRPHGLGMPARNVLAFLRMVREGGAFKDLFLDTPAHPHERLPLALLRRDGGTQIRAGLTDATVAEYQAALDAGAAFPPVVVFHDGTDHWLADGFHRVAAHEAAGVADVLAEVRPGTKRDALLFAVGANGHHGLPRTNADKRRAVTALLQDEEWRSESDRWIAERAGVSNKFVGDMRREWATVNGTQLPTATAGKDGKTRLSPGEASAAIRKLLQDPEWTKASDRKVAQCIGVSHRTVAKVRKELAAEREAAPPHEPCTDARRIHDERVLPMGLDNVARVYEQICELAGGHLPEADRRWLLGEWQERRASLVAEEKSQYGRLAAEIRGMTIDNSGAIYTLIADAHGKSQITEPQEKQLRAAWTKQDERIRRGEHRQDLSPEMRDGRPSSERAANEDQQTEQSKAPVAPPAAPSGQATLALGGATPDDDGDSPPRAPRPGPPALAVARAGQGLRLVASLGSADVDAVATELLALSPEAMALVDRIFARAGAR